MKARIWLLGSGIFLLSYILFNHSLSPKLSKSTPKLKVGSVDISVEIANTQELQSRGLSGKESLDKNSGMYFVFPDKAKRTIWMKDMQFPIDVIWIRLGRVAEITESVTSLGEGKPIITSQEPIDAFLEVNSGFVKMKNIKVGERVELVD